MARGGYSSTIPNYGILRMCAYVLAMSTFTHPRLDDVPLATALHALGDPVRLQILRRLAAADGPLCCEEALASDEVPKSTRSHHFKVLRAAGLVETQKAGRSVLNGLRREVFEKRFPGLLTAVLAAR